MWRPTPDGSKRPQNAHQLFRSIKHRADLSCLRRLLGAHAFPPCSENGGGCAGALNRDVDGASALEEEVLPGAKRARFPGQVVEAARMFYVSITRA